MKLIIASFGLMSLFLISCSHGGHKHHEHHGHKCEHHKDGHKCEHHKDGQTCSHHKDGHKCGKEGHKCEHHKDGRKCEHHKGGHKCGCDKTAGKCECAKAGGECKCSKEGGKCKCGKGGMKCHHGKHGHHHHGHKHKHPHGMGIHHDFSDAEMWSKRFDSKDRDQWQKPQEIVKLMALKPGQTVADIGAGTGYMLPHLSKAVGSKGEVFAIDVEKNLVDFMRKRIAKEKLENVRVELSPMDSPGLKQSRYDKVVFLNTWHHISNRMQYGKKLIATLKPGGIVYLVEPEKGTGGPGPKDNHRNFYEDAAKEMAAVGFSCSQANESLPYQYIAVCKKP